MLHALRDDKGVLQPSGMTGKMEDYAGGGPSMACHTLMACAVHEHKSAHGFNGDVRAKLGLSFPECDGSVMCRRNGWSNGRNRWRRDLSLVHALEEASMPDDPKSTSGRSYVIGNVGAGARVAQGENISWVEGVAGLPDGESLARQFETLLKRIEKDQSLDEDTKALAQDKTKAIAEGLAKAQESPGVLRRALLDARSWFGGTASWVGGALGDILKSEAAQKTIGTITEATTKAAVDAFLT